MGHPIDEPTKISYLRLALRDKPRCEEEIRDFNKEARTLATYTYAALVERLAHQYEEGPKGEEEFAGAMKTGQEESIAMTRTPMPGTKGRAPRERHKPARPIYYCWTHGLCGHTSADCFAPAEGHKKAATINNRMGGADLTPWKGA